MLVSRNKLKKAEKTCHKNIEMFQEIKKCGEKYSSLSESLSKRHTTFTEENIIHLMTDSSRQATCTKFYGSFINQLINNVADIGICVIVIIDSVRAGLQARAQSVYFGLGTSGQAFSIGSVALDVLFIPIIMAILVKSAYDVHKYKNGYGVSNSAAAKNIKNILKKMEENETTLLKVRDQLPGACAEADQDDGNNSDACNAMQTLKKMEENEMNPEVQNQLDLPGARVRAKADQDDGNNIDTCMQIESI